MDEHVFRVLEFDKVRTFLESFAQSAGGRLLCRTTKPSTIQAHVQQLQQETTEMRSEIDNSGPLALGDVHDINCVVQQTRIQNFHLDQQQLLHVAEMLETAATIKSFFAGLQEKTPAIVQRTEALTPLHSLISRIRTCISASADILDTASGHLADLRRQMRSLHANIIRGLEKYLHDVDLNFAVQDDFITTRNNRFVIPVRSDRRASIPGVVHDQSQSKATFFIEPLEILELNNTLQLTQREITHEEIRILNELSLEVQQQEAEILSNLIILEELDVIHARASLSRALAANPALPGKECAISLKNCRHPILSARFLPAAIDTEPDLENKIPPGSWVFDKPTVVEIDIIKKPGINTLVISGVNAGGKTVALKTLGLFILMHQSGMHLPVDPEGRIAHYESLFADIGDEQNIEACLSTFSAHMKRIKDLVMAATARSLVLLDELGSGTDPAEGGALAAAVLDHLRVLGCTTMVTSHLNLLKTYAYTHDDAENISVDFDSNTHRPLYRLVYGLPGFSNALSIARNIGIPESILQAAGSYAGKANQQVSDLVHTLEHSQHVVLEKQTHLSEMNEHSTVIRNSCKRLLESMQSRRDSFLRKFEETGRALLHDSENSLRSIIKQHRRQLRQLPETRYDAHARGQIQQIKQKIYQQFLPTSPAAQTLDHVEPGQTVTVNSLKKSGKVAFVDTVARRAEIDIGAIRVKAGFHELSMAGPCSKKPHNPHRPGAPLPQAAGPSFEKQLNVIGLRVAEALPLIDKSIDTAVIQGADMVEIIHGRGTGRLMRAIHEHLKDHIQVSGLSTDSKDPGCSGVTRVVIK